MDESWSWIGPCTTEAKDIAKIIREKLELLEYEFTREQSEKLYSQTYMIVPMPKMAYVYRFDVTKPERFMIDIYDEKKTHSQKIAYIEIPSITKKSERVIRMLMQEVARALPRPPWKFSTEQMVQYGILTAMWDSRKARQAWENIGVKIKNEK